MAFDWEFHHHEKETEYCEVEYDDCIKGEDGTIRPGVKVTCNKCGHTTTSFGRTEKSIRRCLFLLHEECPYDEDNWYEVE